MANASARQEIPRCPGCGGSRQAFQEDYDTVRGVPIVIHLDNGCELCDEQGRSWGGVLVGDVLERLASLAPRSVSCVVTSPPYWSLRKYAAPDVVWGGEPACSHTLEAAPMGGEGYGGSSRWQHEGVSRQETPDAWVNESYQRRSNDGGSEGRKQTTNEGSVGRDDPVQHATCARCGAWRGQFGLEPTRELYIEHSMMVLRALRRVLRKDGVIWWNLDDGRGHRTLCHDLIPERFLLAAEADGWLVCSKNIWAKPNAMPESAKRRPTDAHENVFMLAKHPSYWYDQEAVREPHTDESAKRYLRNSSYDGTDRKPYAMKNAPTGHGAQKWEREDSPGPEWVKGHSGYVNADGRVMINEGGRNLRSVWTFPTAQTPEAHFATFPPELPRRCIEAATPREVCHKCGLARVRLVETEYIKNRPSAGNDPRSRGEDKLATAGLEPGQSHYGYRGNNLLADTRTVGWSDCPCEEPDYQPGIVLDPFAGTGTSLWVARQLNRRYIGIELSETYAEMARTKLARWWDPPTVKAREVPEGQATLPLAPAGASAGEQGRVG